MLHDLQSRIQSLIMADPWFGGVSVLTEKYGDLESQIETRIARAGMCVIIRSAEGQLAAEGNRAACYREVISVEFVKVITNQWSLITALQHAILAIHDQPVTEVGRSERRFSCSDHRALVDEDGAFSVQQLLVSCTATMSQDNINPNL